MFLKMTRVHGVTRLTSSSGLMSCTALTSATVPLYVTITFGLQLWFIRATLPQTTTIKTLNYSQVFNILRSWQWFGFLWNLLWKYSRTQMRQLLIFNGETITVHLWCRKGGVTMRLPETFTALMPQSHIRNFSWMEWKIFDVWFFKTLNTFILPWNIKWNARLNDSQSYGSLWSHFFHKVKVIRLILFKVLS